MLTYTRNRPKSPEITLNDIPDGTIFYGTIEEDGEEFTGVYLRVSEGHTDKREFIGIYAIMLTGWEDKHGDSIQITFHRCLPVKDYYELRNPEIVERF